MPTDRTAARDLSTGEIHRRTFWSLLLVNVVLVLAGIASTFPWAHIDTAGYAAALVGIGMFTFLMLYVDTRDIRSAITASFVFVYLALIATGPFNTVISEKMSKDFGATVFTNFHTLVAVIVGFYFGGKAIENGLEKRGEAISRARNQ